MTAKDVTKMVLFEAAVFTGTAGATATTPIGYVIEEDSVEIATTSPGGFDIMVQGEKLRLRRAIVNRAVTVTVPAAQLTVDTMALALGLTAVGNTLTIGDANDPVLSPQISLAVVGQDLNGDTVRIDIPYCSASGESDTSLSQAVLARLPIVFGAEAKSGNYPFWTFGDITSTISGGVLTRTQAIHSVIGEGAVADILDSIAGTTELPLIDGETLRLIPSTIAYDVTMTHLNDTLELFGDANFLLGTTSAINAWIDLQYDVADTAWVEKGRFVAAT